MKRKIKYTNKYPKDKEFLRYGGAKKSARKQNLKKNGYKICVIGCPDNAETSFQKKIKFECLGRAFFENAAHVISYK